MYLSFVLILCSLSLLAFFVFSLRHCTVESDIFHWPFSPFGNFIYRFQETFFSFRTSLAVGKGDPLQNSCTCLVSRQGQGNDGEVRNRYVSEPFCVMNSMRRFRRFTHIHRETTVRGCKVDRVVPKPDSEWPSYFSVKHESYPSTAPLGVVRVKLYGNSCTIM